MAAFHATYCVDATTASVRDVHHVQTAQVHSERPVVFVTVGEALSLYGHEPAAFRRLAESFSNAAAKLEEVQALRADAAVSPARGKE